MSRKISLDDTPDDIRKQILSDLTIKIESDKYAANAPPTYIYPFDIYEENKKDYAYIPFAYGNTCKGGPFSRPEKDKLQSTSYNFEGSLRDTQKDVKKEAIEHLNKNGSTIISAYPGFGKTSISIYIASKIKLKTFIICHRIVLINQWEESIKKFCPDATVQILDSTSKKEDCDFYIMNAINVSKRPRNDFIDIGLVIVDEIHCIMSEILSKCLCYLTPRFLIGLSATPYREDGLNILLDLYFGTLKIYKKLHRKHSVYKISTSFTPKMETGANGRVNWGTVLESQASNLGRNEMIINIVKYFPKRVFLILCKRVDQARFLVKRLKEEGEDVTSLIGNQQEFEKSSRILIGTTLKTGTGFDHPRLDTMILAGDVQAYYIQALGRIMRTQDGVPIVFDIVDKNPILEKHYKVRKNVYIEHGGVIKDFAKSFPELNVI